MGYLSRGLSALLGAFLLTNHSAPVPMPTLAIARRQANNPIALTTMSNKAKATAKDVEGKLESAYGELTDDKGHQLKGKAKQAQASAMHAAEDLKEAAKSVKGKISDASEKVEDEVS